jgi:hypothetical protein
MAALQDQEPECEQGQGNMVMPANPTADLVLVHSRLAFGGFEQLFNFMAPAASAHHFYKSDFRSGIGQLKEETRFFFHRAQNEQALFVTNALADQPLPLYGDGMNVRDWIYVEDHCAALDLVLRGGRLGEVYNIGASNERTNRELTELILGVLNKPLSLIRYVSDRPGHDRRYALDAAKMRAEFDWRPRHSFDDALRRTVLWYRDNPTWWQRVKSGDYRTYYQRMYGERLRAAQQRSPGS